jgi:hypothetical protein
MFGKILKCANIFNLNFLETSKLNFPKDIMEHSEQEPIAEISEMEKPKRRSRKIGNREEVFNGICERTSGGLRKEDLVFNRKTGKICTAKEIERGKQLSEMMRKRQPEPAAPEPAPYTSTVEESPQPTPARKPRASKSAISKKKKIVEDSNIGKEEVTGLN